MNYTPPSKQCYDTGVHSRHPWLVKNGYLTNSTWHICNGVEEESSE